MTQKKRPPISVLSMGKTGSGKSTFAMTFPKPELVLVFDRFGKDLPYYKGAKDYTDLQEYEIGQSMIQYRDCIHEDGVIRLEYFHDTCIDKPDAYPRFLSRLAYLQNEYDSWKTIVLDSVTFLELAIRKCHEKVLNPMPRYTAGHDTRQWFAGSTDGLEEILVQRFSSLPMNVVTICHISQKLSEFNGEMVCGPAVPGRLLDKDVLCAGNQEIYRSFTYRDEAGKLQRALQTESHDGFGATSQIAAPDPCWPHYESLWENWR